MNTTFVWTDELRLSGVPCLRGHRFSIAQMLAELADRGSLEDISENFDISLIELQGAIEEISENLPSKYTALSETLKDLADGKNLDFTKELEEALHGLACHYFDQDWTNGPPSPT